MPTAAKLFAAAWFALAGWLAANAHIPALGENAAIGAFREIAALIGLFCGWIVMGNGVGKGYSDAIGAGMKTSIIFSAFALMIFSGYEMIREALKMRYDGPMEAMMGWVNLIMENAVAMATIGVIGVLVLAAFVGGPIAEWAWRRWK